MKTIASRLTAIEKALAQRLETAGGDVCQVYFSNADGTYTNFQGTFTADQCDERARAWGGRWIVMDDEWTVKTPLTDARS